MAVTAKWYAQALLQAMGSGSGGGAPNVDFLSDSIKCMLLTSSYTPDQNAHVFKSDLTNEASGTGYVAGGVALGTKTLAEATLVTSLRAASVVFSAVTLTARYAVIYDATPASDATRPLLWLIDFGTNQSPSGADLTITFSGGVIATITVS